MADTQPSEDADFDFERRKTRLCMHPLSPLRRGKEDSVMERADSLLAPVLDRLGITEEVRLHRIKRDWHTLFDKPLSEHMSPSKLSGKELLLNVDSPIWSQQLTFYKRDITKKLRGYGVSGVRFRIGRITRNKCDENEIGVPCPLSPEDEKFVAALGSDIEDEPLREAVKKAVEKHLSSAARRTRNAAHKL